MDNIEKTCLIYAKKKSSDHFFKQSEPIWALFPQRGIAIKCLRRQSTRKRS